MATMEHTHITSSVGMKEHPAGESSAAGSTGAGVAIQQTCSDADER
jgi:hypothetical protein